MLDIRDLILAIQNHDLGLVLGFSLLQSVNCLHVINPCVPLCCCWIIFIFLEFVFLHNDIVNVVVKVTVNANISFLFLLTGVLAHTINHLNKLWLLF